MNDNITDYHADITTILCQVDCVFYTGIITLFHDHKGNCTHQYTSWIISIKIIIIVSNNRVNNYTVNEGHVKCQE